MSCFESFDRVCRKIVMPTRHDIDDKQMIQRKFRGSPPSYQLLKIKNNRSQDLSTVIFYKEISFPTIIYLHGNGGNKLEVLHLIKAAENYPFNFVAFDFSGCGKSGGEYITYGQEQVDDIHAIVSHMKNKYQSKTLFIWGRSMGASLGLIYGSKYPNQIRAMILDSPFRNLQKIVFNVASNLQTMIPDFLINIAIYFIKNKVKSIVNDDIFKTDYSLSLNSLASQKIHLLFAFSTKDNVVKQQDVMQMYYLFNGVKKISQFSCLHAEDRPKKFIQKSLDYLCSVISMHNKPFNLMNNTQDSFKSKVGLSNLRKKWNN